jgi:hypothetical protein
MRVQSIKDKQQALLESCDHGAGVVEYCSRL